MWVSTNYGLFKADLNMNFYAFQIGNEITGCATQSNGDVWITTKSMGLLKYKKGNL